MRTDLTAGPASRLSPFGEADGTESPAPALKVPPALGSGILRHSPWDVLLVGLALLHGALLLLAPSVPLVAVGLWWNANTVSHNFIHLPFFRSRVGNICFSAFLSLLLGLPQSFWKARHLAHHREETFRWAPLRLAWMVEGALVFLLWIGMAAFAPWFLLTVYLPGWLIGLGLCELHGRLEHARGTVSHYGRLYNWLFFNDGYHVEHHARPSRHWTTLPHEQKTSGQNVSRWPAVLRWLELAGLDGLEELVCRSPLLQRYVLRTHERALAKALLMIPRPRRVVVVGGGLFPRTALTLRRLIPEAELILVDAHEDRLERAKDWLTTEVECVSAFCTAANLSEWKSEADLVIVPLALRGRRVEFYRHPPARHVLIHDWLWRSRGQSVVISWLLLKRLNLVAADAERNDGIVERRSDKVPKPQSSGSPALQHSLSLFGVLVAAKLLSVVGRDLPWSAWTPFALFWQDALVALLFGAVDFALQRRPALGWSMYWLIAGYAAVNLPLTRILSSPFTWQMSKATGGALADSILRYFTPATFALMASVMGAALGFAALARRLRPSGSKIGFRLLAALTVVGAFAVRRVDCSGLHRNALVAFVESALPRVQSLAPAVPGDWRASVVGVGDVDVLSSLRGAAAGRNVVFVSLESTGARYLHCYGAKDDPTPNLTRLAETSLVFENACAVTPESIKGLFSVLCSRYPAFDTGGEDYASVRTMSIAERLAGEGYRTALFHSGRFMYLGMNAVVQQRGFDTLEDAGAIGGNINSSFGVDEPATVERMLAWIDALPSGQRFFLNYLPIAGHHPYSTPERGPFPESEDAGQYLNALHYGDAALGAFLDTLRARSLDTNTLFVIYGDHGEAFGQHGGNYGHTLFIYEENVRVPLVIAIPGTLTEPRRVKRIASLIDLAPTVLDLLGLAVTPDYQGTSLLAPGERAALFFTDYSLPLAGVRDGKWKFITEFGSSGARLFDLESDPEETRNLARQHPDFVVTWQRRLHDWASAQKALVLHPEWTARGEVLARAPDASAR